jgi:hypothetical protein
LIFRRRIARITFRQPLDDENRGRLRISGPDGIVNPNEPQPGRLAKLEVALTLGEKHCLSLRFRRTQVDEYHVKYSGQTAC